MRVATVGRPELRAEQVHELGRQVAGLVLADELAVGRAAQGARAAHAQVVARQAVARIRRPARTRCVRVGAAAQEGPAKARQRLAVADAPELDHSREAQLHVRERVRRQAGAGDQRIAAGQWRRFAFGSGKEEIEVPRPQPGQPRRLRWRRGSALKADAVERRCVVAQRQGALPAGAPPRAMGPRLRLEAERIDGHRAVVQSRRRARLPRIGHRVKPAAELQRQVLPNQFAGAQQQAAAGCRVVAEARKRIRAAAHRQREQAHLLRAQLGPHQRTRVRQCGRQLGGQRVERALHGVARQRPLAYCQRQATVVDQYFDGMPRGETGHPGHGCRHRAARQHEQKRADCDQARTRTDSLRAPDTHQNEQPRLHPVFLSNRR